MKTFVLVHGAWVGEWSYDPIIPLLEERGQITHAVSLTGFGKKRDQHHADISVLDHIQDVVDYVETSGLDSFTLVGHSYGGTVITGAWDRLRDRVEAVVYIDAGTPNDGESHVDNMMQYGGGGLLQSNRPAETPFRPFPMAQLLERDPEKAAYMKDKVMPFPMKCTKTPIHFENGSLPTDVPKTFILAKKNMSYHHKQYEVLKADGSWDCFELDTFHDVMWEDPEGLVKILVGEA